MDSCESESRTRFFKSKYVIYGASYNYSWLQLTRTLIQGKIKKRLSYRELELSRVKFCKNLTWRENESTSSS